MRSRHIVVPFLESRKYVQGTTLFNAMLPYICEAKEVSFKISRILTTNALRVTFEGGQDAAVPNPACQCTWSDGVGDARITVHEDGDAVPLRQPYDEAAMLEAAIIGATAQSPTLLPYSFVETVVSLYKAYLTRLFPLRDDEQFWFTRLDLTRAPPPRPVVELRQVQCIGDVHYAARVRADGADIGRVYFARGSRL